MILTSDLQERDSVSVVFESPGNSIQECVDLVQPGSVVSKASLELEQRRDRLPSSHPGLLVIGHEPIEDLSMRHRVVHELTRHVDGNPTFRNVTEILILFDLPAPHRFEPTWGSSRRQLQSAIQSIGVPRLEISVPDIFEEARVLARPNPDRSLAVGVPGVLNSVVDSLGSDEIGTSREFAFHRRVTQSPRELGALACVSKKTPKRVRHAARV